MKIRKFTIISIPLLICGGVTLLLIRPIVLDWILVLRKNTPLYNLWEKIPVKIETDYYFFNWTNPEDVYNVSVKPRFTQTGPYKFWQTEEKRNVIWNDNDTVTYWVRKNWYYDHNKNNGNLEDTITTVNPTALTAANVIRPWNYYTRRGVSLVLNKIYPTIHIVRSVDQLLFKGYPDPSIKIVSALPLLARSCVPPWDRFGWLYSRNNSIEADGVFNMGIGKNSDLGRLYSWNYHNQNPFFDSPCSSLDGSAGQFFGRNLKKEWIKFFASDMRSSVILKYRRTRTVANILGYEYIGEGYMLDNGTIYSENKCRCNGECLPSGVVNISSTRCDLPMFLSLPHFNRADPDYINAIEGLRPDKTLHEFSITVEPITGIPLEAKTSVQINLLMTPTVSVSLYENVPRRMFPIYWLSQKAKIPYKEAFMLKVVLNVPTIFQSIGILFIIIGSVLLSYLVYGKFVTEKKTSGKNRNPNIPENEPLRSMFRYSYFIVRHGRWIIPIFCLLGGLTLLLIWPTVLNWAFVLQPNTFIFNLWKKIPIQIEAELYFFNWTNPEDVYNKSVKPKFTQTGPYKFWLSDEKGDIIWNDNDTVTYRQRKNWYYSESKENGNLSDVVTTINLAAVSVASVSRPWNYFVRKSLSVALNELYSTVHHSLPVGQLLFKGYPDIMAITTELPFFKDCFLPHDQLGWLYSQNHSYEFDGVFNMGIGRNDDLGRLYSWNYHTQNPFFDSECSSLGESAANFFGRYMKKDTISFFVPEIRRMVSLKFNGTRTVNNILGYEYILEDLVLDNGTIYPKNKCYCNGECLPSGVVNISAPRCGIPLYISNPHFHRADTHYIDSVEGLQPDKDKHEVSVTIEPITGIPLEALVTAQMNLLMVPAPGISSYFKWKHARWVIPIFCLLCGLTLLLIWPTVLNWNFVLQPTTSLFKMWKKIPIQIETDFYFFNWTNPEDVYNKSVKPKFTETGPYKFLLSEEKDNVIWNDNGTVTYRKSWYYNESKENGNLEDVITTVNTAAVFVAFISRPWNYFVRKGLSVAFNELYSTVHHSLPVNQLLFKGYQDIMAICTELPFFRECFVPYDQLGWFYRQNYSYKFDGVLNIGTGKNDDLGRLYSWNYHTQNPFFDSECSSLGESAGQLFGRYLKKDTISFFVPEIRRIVPLKFNRTKTVANILGYEYILEDNFLDNGTIYPKNKCYCSGECIPSGVVNVSAPRCGFPLFVSLPHFNRADPYYIDSVYGLQPDKFKHVVSFTIEPITGFPLEFQINAQLNLLMVPVPGISLFENVPQKMIPILWMSVKAKVPNKEASWLRLILLIPPVFQSLGVLLFIIGLIMLSYAIYAKYTTKKSYKEKNNKNVTENLPLKPSGMKLEIIEDNVL